jgi:uncharacterized protein
VIRIVLDTNVIVSALVFGGVPRGILELAEAGQCQLFYSEPIQTEVRRVLSEKFEWPASHAPGSLSGPLEHGQTHRSPHDRRRRRARSDDNRILECAVEAQAQVVVSGDHHLLALQKYKSIPIVTPREFIELFLAP